MCVEEGVRWEEEVGVVFFLEQNIGKVYILTMKKGWETHFLGTKTYRFANKTGVF